MAFCEITLYKQPVLTKDKNFIIESFEDYLSSLTKVVVDHVQYIKPQLEQTIKLANLTTYLEMQQQIGLETTSSFYAYFNYMKVQYYEVDDQGQETGTNQKVGYYFINSWRWISYNTAELAITMDVLNMIGVPSGTNKYCNWDAKTLIRRSHQNRYKLDGENHPVWNIDRKSEGISSLQYKKDDSIVLEHPQIELKWYFLYRNALATPDDPDNYVEVFIVPETDIKLSVGGVSNTITNIDKWDRTDSRVIKIIEWPYCPTDLFEWVEDDEYEIDSTTFNKYFQINSVVDWGKELKIKDNTIICSNEFTPYLDDTELDKLNPFYYHPISDMIDDFTEDNTVDRNIHYEPKLFHSDFYGIKYLYDTVAKNIKFEDFDFAESYSFKIKFVPSNSAASKLLFKIDAAQWANGLEDFYQYLTANRNNDVVLFNVPYYNYLRTTDTWNNYKQNQQTLQGAFKTGIGMLFSSTPISAVRSGVDGISSLLFNKVNAESAVMEQKDILRHQAASVIGSDDLSLFNEYSKNKLHKIEYDVSSDFKELLFNMFYYTGYIQNKMEIPTTSSRFWFNFVQCEPVFRKMALDLPEGVWDAYKEKWREGTTVFHMHTIDATKKWDLNQNYENMEISLV